MKKIWSVLVLILITHLLSAQDEGGKALLSKQVAKYGQVELCIEYPGFHKLTELGRRFSVTAYRDGTAYIMLSARDIDDFLALGIDYKLLISDKSKAVESASSVEEAMNWDLYPTYQQYDSIVHKLASDYPFYCKVDTIGESIEGRQILALKISDNVETDEDEPEVFYTSNIHGDELQGFVLMLRFAEHLLVNSGNGSMEQALVDSLEIWINPLSNPDGTYYGGDTISTPVRYNSNSVDLNRNFPDPLLPANVPEQENLLMIDFMRERSFVLSANFHSGYEVFNFPWDRWLSISHADSIWFYKAGRRYADTVHNHSVAAYMNSFNDGVVRGAVWYVIYGGRQDFVTYELQGREVTIEIDDTKETPPAQLPLLWEYNYRSFMGYLENAFYGIHGKVVDDSSGQPVQAEIFIQGHDADSSHIYSDTFSGSFVRLINEGTWTIAVSADGYETQYLDNIQTVDLQQTRLNIRLQKAVGIEDTTIDQLKIWPVPAGEIINIQLPEGVTGQQEVSIFNINGSLVSRKIYSPSSESLIRINVSLLPAGIYLLEAKIQNTQKSYHAKFVVN